MNMFSKRHYCVIAKLLRDSDAIGKYQVAQELAKLFQEDNERFDFSKFAKAVGITTETNKVSLELLELAQGLKEELPPLSDEQLAKRLENLAQKMRA